MRAVLFIICFICCVQLSGASYAEHRFFAAASTEAFGEQSSKMKITFLQVGQGDAAFLQLPGGKVILVDGGPPEAGERIMEVLMKHSIKRLDLVISTHPDMDHIGGLISIIQQLPVSYVLDSGKTYDTFTYYMYRHTIRNRHIPFIEAKEGEFLPIDSDVSIQILNSGKEKGQNNESSIVLKVKYGKADFLLMGDADTKTEHDIVKKYDIHADVVKIGHHGSYTSTCKLFLKRAAPVFAVLSYEKGNPYRHPHRSVIKRLKRFGVQVYSTAEEDIEIETDGESLQVQGGLPLPLVQ